MDGNGAAPVEGAPMLDFDALGASSVAVAPAEFVPLETEVLPGADEEASMDLGVLATIPLQVTVELGRTQMLVREVLALQPGSVVELDRIAGEAVDVRINERLVARGEVVIIADKFGIRLTEIMAAAQAMVGGAR
jgi:flagellar motor switch protein FliN/FliY